MIKRLPATVCTSLRSTVFLFDLSRVVEELTFNSLDAGAAKVCISLSVEGCYVQVEDDGCGITREGLVLLGEKLATSKIHYSADRDVDNEIMGYRGETLGSLSDISILEIITKARGKPNGYHKIIKGWKCLFLGIDDCKKDTGTTVVVRDLFYNQAVRRRSMKSSPKKVLCSVKKCITRIALVHPNVSFTCIDVESGSKMLYTFPASSPLPLISSSFGNEVSSSLHEINVSGQVYKLSGYLSRPTDTLFLKAFQCLYINSRFVNKGPIHKLIDSLAMDHLYYSEKGGPEFRNAKRHKVLGCAAYMLKLMCPLSTYDLTIEPLKTAAEFKDWPSVLSFIEQAVRNFWRQTSVRVSDEELNYIRHIPVHTVNEEVTVLAVEKPQVKSRKYYQTSVCEPSLSSPLGIQSEYIVSVGRRNSATVLKRNSNLKSCQQKMSSDHQYEGLSHDIAVHDVQDAFLFRDVDMSFQNRCTSEIQETEKDLFSGDFLGSNYNRVGRRNDYCLWSKEESNSTGVNRISIEDSGKRSGSYQTHDSGYNMEIPFLSRCSKGVRKEMFGSCTPVAEPSRSSSSRFKNHEEFEEMHGDLIKNLFSCYVVDAAENSYYRGISDNGTHYKEKVAPCRDKVATYKPSFMMRRCQTKGELDYFSSSFVESFCPDEMDFPGVKDMGTMNCSNHHADGFDHQLIDSDWCWQSPHFPDSSARNSPVLDFSCGINDSLDTCTFSGALLARTSSCSDLFSIGEPKEFLIKNHGRFCEDFISNTRNFKSDSNLFSTPYKTDMFPSAQTPSELNGEMYPSYFDPSAVDHNYILDRDLPQLVKTQQSHTSSKERSRRGQSAPPFYKRKSKFSMTYHYPSVESSKEADKQYSQVTGHHTTTDTRFALEGFSSPCGLSQDSEPDMPQDRVEFSPLPSCHRKGINTDRDSQVLHEDLFEDKLNDLESKISKWRNGEPQSTGWERPHQISEENDNVLDVSSGILNLAGTFLEPQSISRDSLEDAKVLLQLDKKFIPIVAGGVLAVLDQHAADERIRLEDLRQKVLSGEGNTVTRLESEKELVLPEMGLQLLQSYQEQIQKWGWTCNIHIQCSESHSMNLSILKSRPCVVTLISVPCILGINLTDTDLVEFLEQLSETDGSSTIPPSVNRVLNQKACRGAIMFGDSLLPSECSLILEELKTTSLCFQCAHGRPTTAPLVNIVNLRKQLMKLELQNSGQLGDWHGLHKHKPSLARAQLRLDAAKRFSVC